MVSELNRVRYSGLDFNTHEDEILARLQIKYADVYNDFTTSSLGIMLIDIFAYGLDTLSFYLDRRATDLYLSTARTRKSMSRAARQIGYKMAPAVASSVDVDVGLTQPYDFEVVIPVGFPVNGPNGLLFESREQYSWPAGTTDTKVITFSEGQTVTTTFTSTGMPNQTFEIRNIPGGKFIVGPGSDGVSQVVCEVDGVPWTESDLLSYGSTNQFEIGYNDSPPTLRFGDGIAGNIPAATAEIRLTYFASSGVNGQAKAETITTEASPLVVNFTTIGLSINNPEGASGGSDPESLEKTRALAPLVFKSRNVNVTAEDYEARSSSFVDSVFGAIAVARAISVRGADSDIYLGQLVNDIKGLSNDYVQTVTTDSAAISAQLTVIDNEVDEIRQLDDLLAGRLSTISSNTSSALGFVRSASSDAGVVVSYANQQSVEINDATSGLINMVSSINHSSSGTELLLDATRDDLLSKIAVIESLRASFYGKAQAAVSEADMTATQLESIAKNTSGATGYQGAEDYRAAIRVNVEDISTAQGVAVTAVATLLADVNNIDNNFSDLADEVYAHVDSFLSYDCQANLVEVPVLTLDSEGFYAVPTISLMKSLQSWLDAKKEVTQTVKVVGAADVLVAADITADVGVYQGYVEGTIRSQVEAAILGVLRGRRFGSGLKLSELYWVTQPETSGIAGIEHVNVQITGPSGKIDSQGNLVVEDYEVITRGAITVTSSVVPAV